jgi:hypothetical protein
MFPGSRPSAAANECTVSVTAISSNNGSPSTAGACRMKRPCVAAAKIRVAPASRQRCTARCRVGPGTDQIVDKDRRPVAHVADEQVTGDNSTAAPFFDNSRSGLIVQPREQHRIAIRRRAGAATSNAIRRPRPQGVHLVPQRPVAVAARWRRVVGGHGDLRLEHIYLGPGPVVIDCLEFRADLRCLDAVEELAFLTMECERIGARDIGPILAGRFTTIGGSPKPAAS